jgi:hypothetical protein
VPCEDYTTLSGASLNFDYPVVYDVLEFSDLLGERPNQTSDLNYEFKRYPDDLSINVAGFTNFWQVYAAVFAAQSIFCTAHFNDDGLPWLIDMYRHRLYDDIATLVLDP